MNVRRTDEWSQRGGVLVMTLVFVTMFLVIFIGISGMVSRTYHETVLQAQDELAFQVAEAGLNYARWRLAHNGDDLSAAQGVLTDQLAGDLGEYELTLEHTQPGNSIVKITALGTTLSQPSRQISLSALYGKPSLARYASITNNDVWYGGTIYGPVHANGGIRMDGQSDSLMTSAKETYACQPYHGCSSPYQTKPGIWGTGEMQELWEWPVTNVDYASITLDLLDMRTAAEETDTHYGPSGGFGYQIEFSSNNTYSIYKVTQRGPYVWSWTEETGWQYTSHDVGNKTLIETRAVPSGGVIFADDRVWVKGDIRDRITVAAGVYPATPSTNVDIIVNGNISYGDVHDGTRVFAAVAQRHIQIPWSSVPDNMRMDGAYVAQMGSFHRRYYPNCCGAQAHRLKTSLTRFGMVASNGVPATAWLDNGTIISGFSSGQASYDANLLYGPPPYFPSNSQYELISWDEDQ